MNKVILVGRLVKDVEVRYSQGAEPLANCNFSIAVDRGGRRDANSNEPTADFLDCVAFRKTAEFLGTYGKKGVKFIVEGHLQKRSYTNREGQKVYPVEVVVERVEFAESKASQNGGQAPAPQQAPQQQAPQNGGYQQPQPQYQQPQQAPQNNGYQQPQGGYQQQTMQPTPDPWGNEGGFMSIPDGIDDSALPFR